MKKTTFVLCLAALSCGKLDPEDFIPQETPESDNGGSSDPTGTLSDGGDNVQTSNGGRVIVSKDIGHIPVANRLDYECDDEARARSLSMEFREGPYEDVWAADQLVHANVRLTTSFRATSFRGGVCSSMAIISPRTVMAAIPTTVTVKDGNAGRGRVTLFMGAIECYYNGGADVDDPLEPYRANQAYKGLRYHWSGCSDGSAPEDNHRFYSRYFSLFISSRTNEYPIEVDIDIDVQYPIYSQEELE